MLSDRDVTPFGRADLDVTDVDAVRSAVVGHDVVVDCAAYIKVDRAESDEATARDPISAYGRRKAAGEEFVLAQHPEAAYVVRTAWTYTDSTDPTSRRPCCAPRAHTRP